MLHRLLAYLLIVCLAAPAVAASQHCQPQPRPAVAIHDGHRAHHAGGADMTLHSEKQKPAEKRADYPQHECIGCIAPYSGNSRLPEAVTHFAALRGRVVAAQLDGLATPPALPPPRG